jgi:transcriptional regulator with XRE-family HTH domain
MARLSRGWTLKQAASECGCAISTIWHFENAQRVPSIKLAGDIARAYQLNRDDTISLMAEAVAGAGRDKPSRRDKAGDLSP